MSSNCKKVTNWLLFGNESDSEERTYSSSVRKRHKSSRKYSNESQQEEDDDETELTKSPISGTYIIKDWTKANSMSFFSRNEVELNSIAASFVEITPQSRAKLAKIPNKIGPYECRLCKVVYEDAFELAMHNCPRVVHIEYKCSECEKSFNCPANLASHKRWHKPKVSSGHIKKDLNESNNLSQQSVKDENVNYSSALNLTSSWQKQLNEKCAGAYLNPAFVFDSTSSWFSQVYSSYLNAAVAAAAAGVNNIYSTNPNENIHHQLVSDNRNIGTFQFYPNLYPK